MITRVFYAFLGLWIQGIRIGAFNRNKRGGTGQILDVVSCIRFSINITSSIQFVK